MVLKEATETNGLRYFLQKVHTKVKYNIFNG